MRFKSWLVSVIVFGFTLSPVFAASSTLEKLEQAETQVLAKEYETAIEISKPLLDKLLLNTVEEIILAHKVLGVAYCELGDHPQARNHFETLLTFSPTESIQKLVRTNPCRSLFASIKRGKKPPTKKRKKKPEPVPAKPTSSLQIQPTQPQAETLSPGLWKRYMPFGTGQFANQEDGKAWAFLGTQVGAIASGVTFYLLFKSEEDPSGSFTHPNRANVYRGLVWGSIGLGAVSTAWGIIDAVLVYKKKTKKQKAGLELNGPFLTYRF